ncbi:MAG: hypothetical protein L0Z53_12700 [Acidobacteriales bacterium]|nr:hypothetical protein [Terriglobales bacterium]
MPEYTVTFYLKQERQIEAADLAAARKRTEYLLTLVAGEPRLHSILRADVKKNPHRATCPDCTEEELKLRKKLKPNLPELNNPPPKGAA